MSGLNCNTILNAMGLPLTKAKISRVKASITEEEFLKSTGMSKELFVQCKFNLGIHSGVVLSMLNTQALIGYSLMTGVIKESSGKSPFRATEEELDGDVDSAYERLGKPKGLLCLCAGVLMSPPTMAGRVIKNAVQSYPIYTSIRKGLNEIIDVAIKTSEIGTGSRDRYLNIEDLVVLLEYYRIYISACTVDLTKDDSRYVSSFKTRYVSNTGVCFPAFHKYTEETSEIAYQIKDYLLGR